MEISDVWSRVYTLWRILSLFPVLVCVEMKTGNVFAGTEGDSLDISCNYPDGYQNIPMYFCRRPCSNSDVLIEAQKADEVVSKGRYLALNTVSARSFSVTIKKLTLKDSGVYYCAVDKWGSDKLTKVKITVRKVTSTTAASLSTLQTTKPTDLSSISTVTQSTADSSTVFEDATQSTDLHDLPIYGGMLGLVLCCFLVALVVFYRKRSITHNTSLKPPAPENHTSDSPSDQDMFYNYEEILAVYSLVGPAITEDSPGVYRVAQSAPSAEGDSSLYSFIAPH